MAALRSKTALFDWYMDLKTNLKSNKITVIEFERGIVDALDAFFEGGKEITRNKAELIADILNAVGYDHVFTQTTVVNIAYTLGKSGADTVEVVRIALDNFNAVQVAAYLKREKDQAVKAEEKKTFPKFPTKAEVENWVCANKPTSASSSARDAFNVIGTSQNHQNVCKFYADAEKQISALVMELYHDDPKYVDNILLVDYFISLINAVGTIPDSEREHLEDTLRSLYASPIKTPHIDAFMKLGEPVTNNDRVTVAKQALEERVNSSRFNGDPNTRDRNGLLQQFSDGYCPVTTARQLARTELLDFVKDTTASVLLAIANPLEKGHASFLMKHTRTDTLELENGVLAITTDILRNGIVEMRICHELFDAASMGVRGLHYSNSHTQMHRFTPMGSLLQQFISLWPIPNVTPRFNRTNGGYNGGDAFDGPVSLEESLLSALHQAAAQYRVTPTFGVDLTGSCLLVVMH